MSGAQVDRRTAMKWAGAVAAVLAAGGGYYAFQPGTEPERELPAGYGRDPRLIGATTPWPRTLSADQLASVSALCDFILPAEGEAPSASAIGVHELIDEWVSAPYPDQIADRTLFLAGLDWMDQEAGRKGAKSFAKANPQAKAAILETAAGAGAPKGFYTRFRRVVIGAYYTTEQGFADIGYIGNQALKAYPEPSAEVLAALDRAYSQLGI